MSRPLLINNLIIGGLILILTLLGFVFKFNYQGSVYNDRQDANDGWYYVDDSGRITDREASLDSLEYGEDGEVSVARVLHSDGLSGGDLCFISTNVTFEVYMNDEKVYDFNPEMRVYTGTNYGNVVHYINSPYFDGDVTMRIDAKDMGHGMNPQFIKTYFQSSAQYLNDLMRNNLWKLVLSMLVFVVGLLLVVQAIFFEFRPLNKLEAVSIGVFAMVLAIWTTSGTYMLEVFSSDLGMVRLVNYLSLVFVPLPGLTLVLCATRAERIRSVQIIEFLVLINIICHFIALGFRLDDYHNILYLTHATFLLAVIFAIYHIIYAFSRKKIVETNQIVVLGTFMLVVVAGIVDLIFYYVGGREDMAVFSRIGLLIFICVLSMYELGQLIEISRKSYESEYMKRLAHEDGLTMLGNRLAFTECERELAMRTEGLFLIVEFDINFLKKVNDSYGHTEGDRIIKAGANAIRETFGKYGRIFRTGGDEFIAVIEGQSFEQLSRDYESTKLRFAEMIDRFNREEEPPVPLSIAYGMAEYDCSTGNPEAQERLADERMYEHKKKIKKSLDINTN